MSSSVAAPLIAGIIGSTGAGTDPATVYAHAAGNLFDVTSGSNGSCSPASFCTGVAGFDGSTDLGSPNGPGAF